MATDGGNRLRASDAEREEYGKILRAAMSEGRLTLEEGEERLTRVYAARYRDELPQLTQDLPDGGRQAVYDTPEARADWQRIGRRAFAGHVGLVTVITSVLIGLWALSHAHFFWPAIPILFLVFSLLRHARWRRFAAAGGWGGPPWAQGHRGGPGGHGHGHHGRGPWDRERVAPWNRPDDGWGRRGPQD
jgi:hypothetical protein